jgi:hypothetical protein
MDLILIPFQLLQNRLLLLNLAHNIKLFFIWALPKGRAFRSNLFFLKKRKKGFPLQSLTQKSFLKKTKMIHIVG